MAGPKTYYQLWHTLPLELQAMIFRQHIQLLTDHINFDLAFARCKDYSVHIILMLHYRQTFASNDELQVDMECRRVELSSRKSLQCQREETGNHPGVQVEAELDVLESLLNLPDDFPQTCRGCGNHHVVARPEHPPRCNTCIYVYCTQCPDLVDIRELAGYHINISHKPVELWMKIIKLPHAAFIRYSDAEDLAQLVYSKGLCALRKARARGAFDQVNLMKRPKSLLFHIFQYEVFRLVFVNVYLMFTAPSRPLPVIYTRFGINTDLLRSLFVFLRDDLPHLRPATKSQVWFRSIVDFAARAMDRDQISPADVLRRKEWVFMTAAAYLHQFLFFKLGRVSTEILRDKYRVTRGFGRPLSFLRYGVHGIGSHVGSPLIDIGAHTTTEAEDLCLKIHRLSAAQVWNAPSYILQQNLNRYLVAHAAVGAIADELYTPDVGEIYVDLAFSVAYGSSDGTDKYDRMQRFTDLALKYFAKPENTPQGIGQWTGEAYTKVADVPVGLAKIYARRFLNYFDEGGVFAQRLRGWCQKKAVVIRWSDLSSSVQELPDVLKLAARYSDYLKLSFEPAEHDSIDGQHCGRVLWYYRP